MPRVLYPQTLWEGALLFTVAGFALADRPAAAASKDHPRGRALAVFWTFHIALPVHCLTKPWDGGSRMATIFSLAAVIMLALALVGALAGAFAKKVPASATEPKA